MKQYKVIALSVGGLSNRIYESGDIVPECAFVEGHAPLLVAQGFLEEVTDGAQANTVDVTVSQELIDAHADLTDAGIVAGDVITVNVDDMADEATEVTALKTKKKK